ncbi:MAG: ArdC family protein [Meiothermus sp.]|nr:ArdC family protein [Meiothermus sp.]
MVVEANKTDNQMDALSGAVSKQVERLAESLVNGDTQTLREYLGVMARFNRYSLHNQLLIALQKPDATQVAGYQVWKDMGRQVRRGEQGIRILAPLFRKPKTEEEESKVVYGFKVVSVFDVSQTDGDPLPEYQRVGVGGELGEGLLARVVAACPYPVQFETLPLEQYGLTDGRVIVVNGTHPEAERLVSLLHEWMHSAYHFRPDCERPGLQVRELEAEATAYVLATMLGVEARLGCAEYLTRYGITPALLGGALKQITQAVKEIGARLEGVLPAPA